MKSLNKAYLEAQSAPLMLLAGSLRELGRYQGKQELLYQQRPQLMKTMKEIAIIQSSESSNRIEGIIVEQERLKPLLEKKTKPKNRPEAQVLGYRNMLSKIHVHYQTMEISPELILEMHKEMYDFTDLPAGQWKRRDNLIEEQLPNGEWITRFQPTSAKETPHSMQLLCKSFNYFWNTQEVDRFLLALAFVFDFLSIHPFTDGNGRLSRLLTVLLLHQLHFDVPRYISFEKLVEETKENYYEVLKECSKGWHQGQHRLLPWFDYHISLLLASYKQLEKRIHTVDAGRGDKTAWVIEAINELPTIFAIADVIAVCQGVSRPMIRHVLEQLRKEGKLLSTGAGRSAKWKKT